MRFTKTKGIACCAAALAVLTSAVLPAGAVNAASFGGIVSTKLAAFPGAEGGGMWSTGARISDSVEVYHVTKLEDDGSVGTFRDAVSKPNRVIVFDVAGNIALSDTLTIKADNLTILGQTAPGDGICFKDANVAVTGDNVIMRYLRFRMGDAKTIEDDTLGGRGLNNVIIDHCSISFSVDECASFYQNTNFTMQWCIISESLKESVHDKGNHGYGGIWGGTNASFHHNLLAHHDSRNPRIDAGPIEGDDYDMSTQVELTDLRNNVIYNWGGNSAYGGQAGMPVNIINCYYKSGPATSNNVKSRIYQLSSSGNNQNFVWSSDLYIDGNYVAGNETVTADNSKGVDHDGGSTTKWYVWTKDTIAENADAKNVHFKYEKDYPVTTQTAEDAYTSVLESVGASIVRDSIDTRIINEVKTGTATCGNNGHINTPSDVGGFPELVGTKAKDSDNDGIPNEWEDKNGLDKFDPTDGTTVAPSGYLYVEEYANALASGAYVRDTAYDPDVEDYVPSDDPTESDGPTATEKPAVELVSSWIATSGDEKKPAGSELMPGLKTVIQLSVTKSNEKTFSDGFTHNFAITSKDAAGWDPETGTAKKSALEYTATEDGILTIYAYGVLVKDPYNYFYVVPKGSQSQETDNIFAEPIDENDKKILCEVSVKAGDVNYFYINGSKARFMAAKFEKFVSPSTEFTIGECTFDNSKTVVNVTKNSEIGSNSIIIAAYYDENGIIKDMLTKEIAKDMTVGSSESFELNRGKSENEKVKIFIWGSTSDVKPLANSVTK